ncbi:hypothetical protein FOL47_000605 [Perkinsus chesapeaki]|uniref:Uncharacterized protein n=1 Tax=Perkinsus chesapeaki TaxID=330153 RepID=A0A7J6KW67_PERCH|nr:hypothetical protein FOL47_000605 [Perkinsus chesapeaki]
MKYIDTDAVKFMRDNLLVLEDARKDAEVRMYEYLDLWRIRQEKNLERMAKTNDRVYVPKLFDIVFTSKSPPHRIGHHLDTIWSGPHTVTALKGSSMVEVTNGIIFPGLGRVTVDEDENKVKVPVEYGHQEVFALKNIIHAAALQGVVYEYLDRGSRVYLDADGALKEFKLQDGDSDGKQVEMARKKTELKMLAKEADKSEGLEPPMDGPLPPGIIPEDEDAEDEGSVQLPPGIDPDSPVEEGSSDSSEDIGEKDEVKVDVQYVREQLGYGQGLCFGKFLRCNPPKGSIVISIGESYVGLAMVIDDDDGDDEKILIQPMKVELFGGCISVQKVNNEDLFNSDLSSVVYVSPGSHHWTRRRSKSSSDWYGNWSGNDGSTSKANDGGQTTPQQPKAIVEQPKWDTPKPSAEGITKDPVVTEPNDPVVANPIDTKDDTPKEVDSAKVKESQVLPSVSKDSQASPIVDEVKSVLLSDEFKAMFANSQRRSSKKKKSKKAKCSKDVSSSSSSDEE